VQHLCTACHGQMRSGPITAQRCLPTHGNFKNQATNGKVGISGENATEPTCTAPGLALLAGDLVWRPLCYFCVQYATARCAAGRSLRNGAYRLTEISKIRPRMGYFWISCENATEPTCTARGLVLLAGDLVWRPLCHICVQHAPARCAAGRSLRYGAYRHAEISKIRPRMGKLGFRAKKPQNRLAPLPDSFCSLGTWFGSYCATFVYSMPRPDAERADHCATVPADTHTLHNQSLNFGFSSRCLCHVSTI
jgi:hypothetical protein